MNRTGLPVWLLDIDGVINAFPTIRQPGSWRRNQRMRVKVRRFTVEVARPVLDFIHKVHEEGLAEIRWHTTWQHDAPNLGEILGLPNFAVQDSPEFRYRRNNTPIWLGADVLDWWKLPAAERVLLDEGRPLLWTDDDAADLSDYTCGQLASYGPPLLIVAPDPVTGMVQADLDNIWNFLTTRKETIPPMSDYTPERLAAEASALSEAMRDALSRGVSAGTMENSGARLPTLNALARRGLIEESFRVGTPGTKWRVSTKGAEVARYLP